MGTMLVTILAFWLVGVFISRLQLEHWREQGELNEKCDINVLSLLSWGIYIIYALAWIYDKEAENNEEEE